MSFMDWKRPWKERLARIRVYPQAFLGTTEMALVYGITKAGITNRMKAGSLPVPTQLAMGPVWSKEAVEAYLGVKAEMERLNTAIHQPREDA